ncbi:nucleotidyltransferase domain-containing protein [Streptomyces antibioticus]|uniref:nucleotidyltransferase domain-containing protein n=1 Tax=Streptomyces antibioticus TaxID=1890 RepID=UPI0033B070E7
MPAPAHSDADFLAGTADALAALPTVRAVALGGSRAQGTHRADSDRDLAVYYRGAFDPADLRALGWDGESSEVGRWGGGVFNEGAWQPAVYPPRPRRTAPDRWYGTARATLAYARAGHAPAARRTEAAGALAVAATQVGHAVPAARGEWVTNEKRLLERAGLRAVDDLVARLGSGGSDTLDTVLGQAETLFAYTVRAALA